MEMLFVGGLWGNDSYGKTCLDLALQGDLTHESGERLVQKTQKKQPKKTPKNISKKKVMPKR